MLKPAILYKEELNNLFAIYSTMPEYKFFNQSENLQFAMPIDECTWHNHQYVSVDNGQNILGFMSASMDRYARFVNGLSLIAFKKNKPQFIKDFHLFMITLFTTFNYHKARWSVVCGSPHEKTYDKLCKIYGGRVVGIFENENQLMDGKLYNQKWYELKREIFIDTAKKIIEKQKIRSQNESY